jgi:hypothetical protein
VPQNDARYLTVVSFLLLAPAVNAQWYSNSWTNRKLITIQHGQVSGSLSSFPVLISLATDSDLAAAAQVSGNDILFTDSNGTSLLNYEIESYTSSTGKLIAWVKVPSLSTTSDALIYMYYGNSSAAAAIAANKQGTWDSNYAGVWHLPNGTTLSGADATANANNGTVTGVSATGGKIDGGASLSGSAGIIIPNSSSVNISGAITLEAWVYPIGANVYQSETLFARNGGNDEYTYAMGTSTSTINFFPSDANCGAVSISLARWTYDAWNHVVITVDAGGGNYAYINGVQSALLSLAPVSTGTDPLSLGL